MPGWPRVWKNEPKLFRKLFTSIWVLSSGGRSGVCRPQHQLVPFCRFRCWHNGTRRPIRWPGSGGLVVCSFDCCMPPVTKAHCWLRSASGLKFIPTLVRLMVQSDQRRRSYTPEFVVSFELWVLPTFIVPVRQVTGRPHTVPLRLSL